MKKTPAPPSVRSARARNDQQSEKENAEVRIEDPSLYQSIVDAEWKIIYDKLDNCVKVGATVVLSKLPIGDLATQYFADRHMFCAGRVAEEDLDRVAIATGATVRGTGMPEPTKPPRSDGAMASMRRRPVSMRRICAEWGMRVSGVRGYPPGMG